MRVIIDNDTALNMLMNRLNFWTDDAITTKLYNKMYERYIDDGCFEDGEFDIMTIVDNDYVNYCKVLSIGDEDYDKVKELYEQGETDISEETCYSFIEAEENGYFLVRC